MSKDAAISYICLKHMRTLHVQAMAVSNSHSKMSLL